jgi:hypothetical protein
MPVHYCVALAFGIAIAGQCLSGAANAHPADPADPYSRVPAARYIPVLRDLPSRPIPDEPGDWIALNRQALEIGGPTGQLKEPDVPLEARE